MQIRILQLEGTGIDPTQYRVGDVVEAELANPDHFENLSVLIPDARPSPAYDSPKYLLLPAWFEVVS